MYIILFISLIFLIILSYFFSGAETSLISVNIARIHELSKKGNNKAVMVAAFDKQKSKILGVILLGNTVANITASSLATILFVEFCHNEGFGTIISLIVMTFVLLIFAEVLPKTYAVYNPEKVALFSAPIINVIVICFAPIINLIQLIVDVMLKILSFNKEKEVVSASDAIRNLIDLHKSDNTMLKQDIDMLGSVLDLAETEISDIMTHRKDIIGVSYDCSTREIIQKTLDSKHINVPLWKNKVDNIEWVINVYDLMVELRIHKVYEDINLRKIMSKPVFTPDTTQLSIQLYNFRMHENNFAVVVDEYGSLQGIVTLSDILKEIVGDIHYDDKYDILPLPEGGYSINGKASVRDINRKLQWDLSEKGAATIVGLIVNAIERIPETGEEFNLFGVRFKILHKDKNIITRVGAVLESTLIS